MTSIACSWLERVELAEGMTHATVLYPILRSSNWGCCTFAGYRYGRSVASFAECWSPNAVNQESLGRM